MATGGLGRPVRGGPEGGKRRSNGGDVCGNRGLREPEGGKTPGVHAGCEGAKGAAGTGGGPSKGAAAVPRVTKTTVLGRTATEIWAGGGLRRSARMYGLPRKDVGHGAPMVCYCGTAAGVNKSTELWHATAVARGRGGLRRSAKMHGWPRMDGLGSISGPRALLRAIAGTRVKYGRCFGTRQGTSELRSRTMK